MKLLEHEAKKILEQGGVAIPKSYIATSEPDFLPAVVKSQVPTGGRGKAGGIIVAHTPDEYTQAVEKVLQTAIKGFTPKTVLAEELITIDHEYYLSLLVDKKAAMITVMAHKNGGVEVEDNPSDSYFTYPLVDNIDFDSAGQSLADYYDLPGQTFALQDLLQKLYGMFIANDATLLEINPLILTSEDKLIAGDCKMELDDAAAFRHQDWQFEAEKSDSNFVTLDQNGTVATIANGAGLAMATVDAVADAGLTPANFLDIGGGASEASVLAAFTRLAEYPNLKVIIINIFAGITRCDEVAKAILAAREKIPNLPPLTIRLAGTNYQEAADILAANNIAVQPSLASTINLAKQEVN